jgi:hypothetical protein
MRAASVALAIGVALSGAACAETDELEKGEEQPGVVRVSAPAGMCWSGAIGDSTKEGCGSQDIDIEGEAIIVANAQKQTPGRWELTLVLEVDGEQVDESTTDAEFGIAQVAE